MRAGQQMVLSACVLASGWLGTGSASLVDAREDTESTKLVSRVGPVSSFVHRYESTGGAHPSYGCSLYAEATTDRPKSAPRPATIVDLFDEADAFEALIHAWPIFDALKGKNPSSLTDLFRALERDCGVDWEELPTAFAIMDVRDDWWTAVVRFGLGHGCEAARGHHTQFDVLMRISPDRQAWFKKAVAEKTLAMAETCGGTHEWSCCLRWSK